MFIFLSFESQIFPFLIRFFKLLNMVFGKRKHGFLQESQDSQHYQGANLQEDSCDEIEEVDVASGLSQPVKTQTTLAADSKQKPLLNEVTITSTSVAQRKSSGDSKRWICKHCKQVFTSSYTRIHAHFFGPEPGKRCDIQRYPITLKDRK